MATAAFPKLLQIERVAPELLNASRTHLLVIVLASVPLIAFLDSRWVSVSLSGLYILPMLLASIVLRPRTLLALACVCAVLRCLCDDSHYAFQYAIHFGTSFATYILSGLFVMAVMRNRQMALAHVAEITQEQRLRNEAQERLRIMIESSPAAILTLDPQGIVLAANRAANVLFGLEGGSLERCAIKSYLPMLSEALRLGTAGKPFRTAAQAQGRKKTGEIFLADLWFSTYPTSEGTQLAAIVVDSSEQLRDREQENLRQLSTNSRLVMGAVLHEVRNFCSAITVVYSNLKEKSAPCRVDEIRGLETLVRGLGRVASLELYGKESDAVDEVTVQEVLDELRIIIEPGWTDIGAFVSWRVPVDIVRVTADRYGLLQVFLNLAQNSLRAVHASSDRFLEVNLDIHGERALITFADSGPGIPDPHNLFQPFQPGADVTGLGLFISRALVRSYGGDLQFRAVEKGSCFVVELPLANG